MPNIGAAEPNSDTPPVAAPSSVEAALAKAKAGLVMGDEGDVTLTGHPAAEDGGADDPGPGAGEGDEAPPVKAKPKGAGDDAGAGDEGDDDKKVEPKHKTIEAADKAVRAAERRMTTATEEAAELRRQNAALTAQVSEAQEKISEKWMKSVKDAAGKYTDYEAAVDSPEMAKLIPVGSMLNSLLVDSELGGEILYHLATHKDEIKRISVLPPIAQAREVFKLETTLSGSPVQTETEEVPPPPRSLGSGEILPANAVTAALQAKDAGAYMKAANEEDKKRLKK